MLGGQPIAAPTTNAIEQKIHVVRVKHSIDSEEFDIDDLVAKLEQEHGLSLEMSAARQWLAEDVPDSLSKARLSKGFSQAQLAAKVGLRQPNISAIESGKRKPDYDTARKIADVLGLSVEQFYSAFDNSQVRS